MKRSSLEPSLGGVVGNGMGQRGEQVPVPHLGGGLLSLVLPFSGFMAWGSWAVGFPSETCGILTGKGKKAFPWGLLENSLRSH